MQLSLGLQDEVQSGHVNAKPVSVIDVVAPVDGVNVHARDIPS